jgi:hypothetical protein
MMGKATQMWRKQAASEIYEYIYCGFVAGSNKSAANLMGEGWLRALSIIVLTCGMIRIIFFP